MGSALGEVEECHEGIFQHAAAQATKAAWDAIRLIDIECGAYASSGVDYFSMSYLRYAQLSPDYLDPDLQSIIEDWKGIARDAKAELTAINSELAQLSASVDQVSEGGAAVGSMYRDNPQAGAAILSNVFRQLAEVAADARSKEIIAAHDPAREAISQRISENHERRAKIARVLAQRYGLPFN